MSLGMTDQFDGVKSCTSNDSKTNDNVDPCLFLTLVNFIH